MQWVKTSKNKCMNNEHIYCLGCVARVCICKMNDHLAHALGDLEETTITNTPEHPFSKWLRQNIPKLILEFQSSVCEVIISGK